MSKTLATLIVLAFILPVLYSCEKNVRTGKRFSDQIMGQGSASRQELTEFLLNRNPGLSRNYAERIVNAYVDEAGSEGVNWDVAFAQMCLETNFLRFGNQVKKNQNNFCGLGATDDGAEGAAFGDPETGVRAHIQHLKAYASSESLRQKTVDPRFKYVKRGSAKTIDELAGKWASDKEYGKKIRALLQKLLSF